MIVRVALGLSMLLATGSNAGEMVWGVNGHPIVSYPGIGLDAQLDLVEDLGTTSYRVNISFAEQASTLEELVDAAGPRGISILPVLTPGLADLENDPPDVLRQKAFDFASELAARLGEDIPVWELGNELENYAIVQPCETLDDGTTYSCDWGPAGGTNAIDYYGPRWEKVSAVLRGLSEGISAVDPRLRKAIGTAGWGHVGAFERMRADGIAWDISVWHMYGQDPEWAFEILQDYGQPIWVTEFNHPWGSRDGVDAQASGLRQSMERLTELSSRYDIEAAYVYQLLDETYWAPGIDAFMGLVTIEPAGDAWTIGAPKPAYAALRDYIDGARSPADCFDMRGDVEDPAELKVSYAYCLVLRRAAEPDEVDLWAAALRSEAAAPLDMVFTLLRSTEFRQASEEMDNPAYVTAVYRRLLDRGPDAAGLNGYMALLADGSLSRAAVAEAVAQSDEFASRHPDLISRLAAEIRSCALPTSEVSIEPETQVRYAYCLLLGRDVDSTERADWTTALDEGSATVDDLLRTLVSSAEFDARHQTSTLTDRQYVELIYRLMIGRDPDGQGLEAYSAQLSDGTLTRISMASSAMQSAEFAALHPALMSRPPEVASEESPARTCDLEAAARIAANAIRRAAYANCLILGRDPDDATLRDWANRLAADQIGGEDLVVEIYQSERFDERYEPDGLSDRAFVELVYEVFLLRDADTLSLEAYVEQLQSGSLERENVAIGTIYSSEFAARHVALAE